MSSTTQDVPTTQSMSQDDAWSNLKPTNLPPPRQCQSTDPPTATATTTRRRRRLRPLIISMGGSRRSHLEEMFTTNPTLSQHFATPTFSPGISQRSIRSARGLLSAANDAGLIPEHEWNALSTKGEELYRENPLWYLDCLTGGAPGSSSRPCDSPIVPIYPPGQAAETGTRMGSERDKKLHYSIELWWKAKSLSRQRGVLGCFLAHLVAMRKFVEANDGERGGGGGGEGGFDFILEDNVRVPVGRPGRGDAEASTPDEQDDDDEATVDTYCECAARIWATIDASEKLAESSSSSSSISAAGVTDGCGDTTTNKECHLRYYGWLGSKPNLEWLFNTHARRMRERDGYDDSDGVIFPYPTMEEFRTDNPVPTQSQKKGSSSGLGNDKEDVDDNEDKGSGTPIWGAYAYYISRPAYEALLSDLRNDVGGILWKSKGMRSYLVKPIDKVLPRRVIQRFGRDAVHVTALPAFVRAPMLRSTIHSQWDVEFCKSSEYQMQVAGKHVGRVGGGGDGDDDDDDGGDADQQGRMHKWRPLGWEDLWLTEEEREVIARRRETGDWSFIEVKKAEKRR